MLSTQSSPALPTAAARVVRSDRAPESKGRVLIVEEDRYALERYADALLAEGFDIAAACDGAAALRALRAGPFDLVLADLDGPGGKDAEILRTIRSRGLAVPVMLVTGRPVAAAAQAEAGAVHYLRKPVPADELARCAGRATRQARDVARGGGTPGGPGHAETAARERAVREARFSRALASLYMTYQPILRARDGSVFGWEALLRTEEAELAGPLDFLDLAEKLDAVHELGHAIRASVARTARRTRGVMFFVNLHRDDLSDEGLFDLSSPLSSLAPDVVLEITERSPLESVPEVHERVRRLRALGFRLAIDDLGSGHATLASFASLQPDFVKVDRGLVHGVDRDPVRREFMESLISLSHEMGIPVVAEGVETAAERQTVTELGCDLMQGFLFRRPDELGLDERFQLVDEVWAGAK